MQTSLDHDLETCKSFVSCQRCKHNANCPSAIDHKGYCLRRIVCIKQVEALGYCYGCKEYCDKSWIFGYVAEDPLSPSVPAPETEFQKMLEFFFPKKRMRKETTSEDDPWEFL